jgi:hypothetical protein
MSYHTHPLYVNNYISFVLIYLHTYTHHTSGYAIQWPNPKRRFLKTKAGGRRPQAFQRVTGEARRRTCSPGAGLRLPEKFYRKFLFWRGRGGAALVSNVPKPKNWHPRTVTQKGGRGKTLCKLFTALNKAVNTTLWKNVYTQRRKAFIRRSPHVGKSGAAIPVRGYVKGCR